MSVISKETYTKLTAEFPPEALSVDDSRGFALTSVRAQWIVERLNEVLGVDGWQFTGKYEPQSDGGVLYFGQLTIVGDEGKWHTVEGVGFAASKKNLGDTYKGARTDALSKAASLIGVANSVFKGMVKPPEKSDARKTSSTVPPKFPKPTQSSW